MSDSVSRERIIKKYSLYLAVLSFAVFSGCSDDATGSSETQNHCGNGTIEGDEQCDDHNTENKDGCDEHCQDGYARSPL